MVTLTTGNLAFMMIAAVTGSVLFCLAAGIMRGSFRVHGIPSWLLLPLLAGVPAGLAMPLALLVRLPPDQPLVLAGMALTLGLGWYHMVLPRVLPDFHTDSFAAAGLAGLVQSLAVYLAGLGTGYFTRPF